MTFTVESGIPLPPARKSCAEFAGVVAVIRQMQIGDSVLVKTECPKGGNRLHTYAAAGNRLWKFSVRKVEGGYRIWRIA